MGKQHKHTKKNQPSSNEHSTGQNVGGNTDPTLIPDRREFSINASQLEDKRYYKTKKSLTKHIQNIE